MSKPKINVQKTPQALTRKHLARVERERIQRRWLIGVFAGIMAAVAGLVLYPVFEAQLIQPGQPVAVVNGVELSTRDFQKRVRQQRTQLILQYWNMASLAQYFGNDQSFTNQIQQVQSLLTSDFALGRDTLDQMIADELVRQEAARRGITVSDAEIDGEIRQTFRYYPNGTPTPEPSLTPAPTRTAAPTSTGEPSATPTPAETATPTETQVPTETATTGPTETASPIPSITPTATPYTQSLFDRDYRDFLAENQKQSGMSEAEVRALFAAQILKRKLQDAWEADPQVDAVHARHILVADEATANDILEQLKNGADFAALAAEYSTDPSNKDTGGDLGFFQRGQMVPEFEAAAFDNPVGLVPEPVMTSFGWHIIEVLEKRNESDDSARARGLNDWLQAQRNDPEVVQTFDYWENRVPAEPVFDPNGPPTPYPTSEP
jgi:peptidyl-prolyl cis-trans isomerase D